MAEGYILQWMHKAQVTSYLLKKVITTKLKCLTFTTEVTILETSANLPLLSLNSRDTCVKRELFLDWADYSCESKEHGNGSSDLFSPFSRGSKDALR